MPTSIQVLYDRNYEDAYTDPGSPASRRTPQGTYVLAQLADESGAGRRRLLLQVGVDRIITHLITCHRYEVYKKDEDAEGFEL